MNYEDFLNLPVNSEIVLTNGLGNRYEKINKETWRFLGHGGKRGIYLRDGNYRGVEFGSADFMSSLARIRVLTALELIAELAETKQ